MVKSADNHIILNFQSRGENVSLARLLISSLVSAYDMTLSELDEIRVAVSEAVSNAIIHGYENAEDKNVEMEVMIADSLLTVIIRDQGRGIADIEQAMEPNYSCDEERLGLGFSFMQAFMDTLEVDSHLHKGTTITMSKKLKANQEIADDKKNNDGLPVMKERDKEAD